MTPTFFSCTADILAPPQIVWPVMADVERWAEWTPSISRIKLLTPGPLQPGSRARVHQPQLLPAWWRVTELVPGSEFTWISVAPGARVEARHAVEPIAGGCRATLSLRYEGWLGRWIARWLRVLTDRYLDMEAYGLKVHCEQLAQRSSEAR